MLVPRESSAATLDRHKDSRVTVDPSSRQQPSLACPVCEVVLERRQSAFTCENGHSFDVAKEGYVNLLPSQYKRRGVEGDALAMLQARRRFLDRGCFAPLLDALAARVGAIGSEGDRAIAPTVAEAGCGEGYYIGNIQTRLADISRANWLGTDISRPAVRMAAKRYPHTLFFVSDVHTRIYLPDASVDLLLDVFAPRNPVEFARVVKPGGGAFVVIPSQSHLAALRTAFGLLDIEQDKERKLLDRFASHFRLIDRSELRFLLELDPDAVDDLIEMGPSRWHGPRKPATSSLSTEASLVLLHLQRG
ncbi:MAG TPA: methyltransferase domain-containing protein [Coriobacteriia bacterium]|nr:methyltransferase domain-containing protein [Coriobacteriia bacterium]